MPKGNKPAKGKQMSVLGKGIAHAKPVVSEQKPVWLGRRERDAEQTEVLKGWQGWLGRLWEVDLKTSGCLVGTKPVSTAISVGNDVKSSQKLPDE